MTVMKLAASDCNRASIGNSRVGIYMTIRKHETLTQGWFNVGQASQTVDQHSTNLEWVSRVCWGVTQ